MFCVGMQVYLTMHAHTAPQLATTNWRDDSHLVTSPELDHLLSVQELLVDC